MDPRHREALVKCSQEISGKTGIALTTDLLAALNLSGLFPKTWIAEFMIPDLSTSEQIQKMLDLLPKRGPDAFRKFVDVLNYDYPWLSNRLSGAAGQTETERITNGNSPEIDSFDTCDKRTNDIVQHNLELVSLVDGLQRVQEDLQNSMNDIENENKTLKLQNAILCENSSQNHERCAIREQILENKCSVMEDELCRVRYENEALRLQISQTREERMTEYREERRWSRLRDKMRSTMKSV